MSVTSYGATLGVRPEGDGTQIDQIERSSAPQPPTGFGGGPPEVPLFQARPDSIAERLGDRFASWHPLLAGAATLAIGYVALALATIALGVLLVEVILTGSVARWDNGVINWLAKNRTPLGTDWSWVGSHLAETGTVLVVVAVVTLILCLKRRFLAAIFFTVAIAVEAATYLATTLVIDRPRPHVVRFENLGPGASYPSGHTAAALVIYVGIAMLVWAYVHNRAARVAAVVIAVVAPIAVGLARMYRGMHHPIDVMSGLLIGGGCLLCRVARRAGRGRGLRASPRDGAVMTSVAVIAHTGKSLGGGLEELRRALGREGVDNPIWFEVPKSRKAPKRVRAALDAGADLVIVWGGDGMVQRCIDAIAGSEAGSDVRIGIVPAGTANLLATNLGIPRDIEQAVRIALHGHVRKLDVGRLNGERFAVMAGAGWDALMIRDADGALKDRLGRVAYVWTGARHLREDRFHAVIKVDDQKWFDGKASCVLVGNVGKVFGGIQVFEGAKPRRRTARARRDHRQGARCSGRARWRAPRSARLRPLPLWRPRRPERFESSSTVRFVTSSTAATATRFAACASTSNRARSPSVFRTRHRRSQREHRRPSA